MAAITLKEIAQLAGVSVSTVSLVLNNRPCRISDSTKDKIRMIAKEHNYRPNAIARSLVMRQSKTLGLIIPDIENLFFSTLAKSLEMNLRKEGYSLIIMNTDEDSEEDYELLNVLVDKGIDGLFIIISNDIYLERQRMIDRLDDLRIPFIMVDRIFDDYECNKVYFNNFEGSYKATRHLIEAGHKQIACLAHTIATKNTLSRLNGYIHAMRSQGLKVQPEQILLGNYKLQSGYDACRQFLETGCTALLVCNDMMALGVIKYLFEQAYKIPEDYSIVSYDNQLASYLFEVSLTSVDQNVNTLGVYAAQLMLKLLDSGECKGEPVKICLEPELIIRKSVKDYNL